MVDVDRLDGLANGGVAMPATPTTYHRILGTHAPALNRLLTGLVLGVVVASVLAFFVAWQLAVLAAWDTMVAVILAVIWHEIYDADSARTRDSWRRRTTRRATPRGCS